MKKTLLTTAIAAAFTATSAQAVTFNFGNSTTAGVQGTDFSYTCNTSSMNAGKEFRMCDPSGNLGGGLPTKKDTINGNEQWMFSGSTTGLMTGVANTATTGGLGTGVTYYIDLGYVNPSIDRNGGPGLDQGAEFFNSSFGFLAPTVGSDATTVGQSHANDIATSAGVYTATSATTFTIDFAVLEAQWAGTHFSLGRDSGGITFHGTTDGTNFSMWAEEKIDASEDNGAAGFGGWTAEWYYVGTIDGFHFGGGGTPEVPVPAAVWLFGSGLLGLVGVARRKKSTA
jgi:hypothetical protein